LNYSTGAGHEEGFYFWIIDVGDVDANIAHIYQYKQ